MDCKTAQLLLAVGPAITSELDEVEARALDSHLAQCDECASLARSEHGIDRSIRLAMQNVSPPAHLRDGLIKMMEGRHRKTLRNRILLSASAAAILAGVALGGWWWHVTHLPVIDPESAVNEMADVRGTSREGAQEWLASRHGVKVPLPTGFNYAYLDWVDMQDHYGKLVPHLQFVRPGGAGNIAHVFILTADKFNLKEALEKPPAGSRGITVEIRPSDEDRRVAYEIVFTGDSLEWLLQAEPPGV